MNIKLAIRVSVFAILSVVISKAHACCQEPVASFSWQSPVYCGDEVTFTCTSTDADSAISSRTWTANGGTLPTGSGSTFTTKWCSTGPETVTLRVLDSDSSEGCPPDRDDDYDQEVTVLAVQITDVTSDVDYACVDCDVEFTVTTSPADKYGCIEWSAPGGDPQTGSGETFITKWDTPGPKTVRATGCSNFMDKQVTIVKVDLDMSGVADEDEESVGGFIALNDDDDDDNEKADKDESGPITDEDNLVKITLRKVLPTNLTGNVTLKKVPSDSTKIKIWENETKGGSPITLPATYSTPSDLPEELWVEGFENSSSVGDITLALEYTIGGKTFDDKIKLTIIKVDVEVAGGDDDTYEIPSVKVPSKVPDDHFVTVKGEGNITLWATTIPDDLLVDETISWTGMTQHPLEKLSASKSRIASGKFPATINVCGRDAKDLTNWVVWSTCNTPTFSKSVFNTPVTTGDGTTGPGMSIQFTVTSGFAFTISPSTIITDSDRPNLSGSPAPVPGATQTHVISGNALAGGANNVWDESRRIRVKALNPHLYTKNELDLVGGHLWNNQPVPVDVPEDYPPPSNDVIGNDDSTTGDEDNDPYNSPNIGLLTASDDPSSPMRHSTGSDGDTFEVRYHFGEFARLKLSSTWYRISVFTDWKTHFKYKRVGGQWIDDGSFAAANNNGWQ